MPISIVSSIFIHEKAVASIVKAIRAWHHGDYIGHINVSEFENQFSDQGFQKELHYEVSVIKETMGISLEAGFRME